MNPTQSRRAVLRTASASAAAVAVVALAGGGALPTLTPAAQAAPARKFRKAVKYGMIGEGKTVREKFELIRSLGFDGVEVDAPGGPDKQETLAAVMATGIKVHGVVDAVHWQQRLSDPDAAVRERGLQALLAALDDAKFYGASTVLLVPGKVGDPANENFEQAWARSTEQVRKAVPKAKELGVHIAIEIVWNDLITSPALMVKYVDQFADPIVGAYLDPSNVLRYGKDTNTRGADWVRALGHRLLKFDFKGYSHALGFKANIGEGDENWPDVLEALAEVGYKDVADGGPGWATAEVGAGNREHLRDVAARMDKVLGMA